MQFEIKTKLFQDLVAKAVKGASFDKVLPLTHLMSIELSDNRLTLTTTDMSNYLYVALDKVPGENFKVTVYAETFSKLVAKMTSEFIKLELVDEKLVVKGDGKYTIELPVDADGGLVVFPDKLKNFNGEEIAKTHASTIRVILDKNKNAIDTSAEPVRCYTGYYIGKSILTSDGYKVCSTDIRIFKEPLLLDGQTVKLLELIDEEDISVEYSNGFIKFSSDTCVVYGPVMDCIDDFAVDALEGLVSFEFNSMCKLPKSALMRLLERVLLFVREIDDGSVRMTFTKDGLMVTTRNDSGNELINYQTSDNFKDFSCLVNAQMLLSQLKSINGELVELWYGQDNAIKLVEDYTTIVIALSEDE